MENTGEIVRIHPVYLVTFLFVFLTTEFVWSHQQIQSPYLEKVAFLATEARVDVRKGIRLLTTVAPNEMWKIYLTLNYK